MTVQLQQVRFSWRAGQPALYVPELEIAKGERVFIKGPSGSGKTTLLNLLAGIVQPDEGEISLLDQSLSALRKGQLDQFRADHIGFVFQQLNLLPYLGLVENVTLGCSFSTQRKARALSNHATLEDAALSLLEQLGLRAEARSGKPVLELSTGQQQRVAVARALLGQPEIIIADEPTSALDVAHRDNFIQLLTDQCQISGSSLIFVSHDPSLQSYFSRVIEVKPYDEGGFTL